MELTSNSFSAGQPIPQTFAFGRPDPDAHVTFAENRNPHLAWRDVPDDTRSFALICADPDVPSRPDDVNVEGREVPSDLRRVDFFHWVLADLPSSARVIEDGEFSAGVVPHGKDPGVGPQGSRAGINDYTDWFAGDPDMEGRLLRLRRPLPTLERQHPSPLRLHALRPGCRSCAYRGPIRRSRPPARDRRPCHQQGGPHRDLHPQPPSAPLSPRQPTRFALIEYVRRGGSAHRYPIRPR